MRTLYVIRHGIAADRALYAKDSDRPLTPTGQQKTEKVAQRLVTLGIVVSQIVTSPLVRARQTADILQAANLSDRLAISPHLAPGGRLEDWLDWWMHNDRADDATVAIVGHEPDLGTWVERLVWGETKQHLVVKKAGVLGVSLPVDQDAIGHSELFWLTPPRFLL
jgi:phosphohistidine phosphatase